jgi:hypothetical protein
VRQRAAEPEEDLGLATRIMTRLAQAFLLVGTWASAAAAHHPGGEFEPLVLIDDRKDGYRAVLEVYPPDPVAGSPTQFMLWVTPDRWGPEYRGAARLWIQDQSAASAAAMAVPMPDEGRGAGVFLGDHRFDRSGTYRIEVELVGQPTRWTGSLRVNPASQWILRLAKLGAPGVLVAAFVFFLWWRETRRRKAPSGRGASL